jgi:hypothetical protein
MVYKCHSALIPPLTRLMFGRRSIEVPKRRRGLQHDCMLWLLQSIFANLQSMRVLGVVVIQSRVVALVVPPLSLN